MRGGTQCLRIWVEKENVVFDKILNFSEMIYPNCYNINAKPTQLTHVAQQTQLLNNYHTGQSVSTSPVVLVDLASSGPNVLWISGPQLNSIMQEGIIDMIVMDWFFIALILRLQQVSITRLAIVD